MFSVFMIYDENRDDSHHNLVMMRISYDYEYEINSIDYEFSYDYHILVTSVTIIFFI